LASHKHQRPGAEKDSYRRCEAPHDHAIPAVTWGTLAPAL
jgi:hypothetical protein